MKHPNTLIKAICAAILVAAGLAYTNVPVGVPRADFWSSVQQQH